MSNTIKNIICIKFLNIKKVYFYFLIKINDMAGKYSEMLEHATSQGYRSNVVKPLLGMMIIILAAIIFLYKVEAIIFANILGGIAILLVLAFLFSYFYCLFKNPDLLRSERYNLEKTALEKIAISGDSMSEGKLIAPNMDYVVIKSINDADLGIKNIKE